MSSKRVRLVGPQPPPRHGVSAVNESVASLLRERELTPVVLNTAPAALGRGLRVRLSRWSRLSRAALGLVRHSGGVSYFSLSGGYGLLYEIFLTGLARVRGQRLILHHHSFRYLDSPFAPMRWLVRVTGSAAVHVVLGEVMARRLRIGYAQVGPVLVLSNAAFMPAREVVSTRSQLRSRRVGHLSNLSPEKGLWDVLATARLALERGEPWEFVLAGPFESDAVAAEFAQRSAGLSNIRHIGPVYAAAKDEFFAQIGVLLFPTRYRNEAEPLVIHEGLRAGCAVVAFDRGCIAGLVDETCGRLVARTEDFASVAIESIARWNQTESTGLAVSVGAKRRAAQLKAGAESALADFLALFNATENKS